MFGNNSKEEVENKLVLLYVFDKFDIPVTNTQLTEFVMENDLLNYFLLQQFLSELVEAALVEYTDNQDQNYYLITEKGKSTLKYFKDRLIIDLTEIIDSAVEKKKRMLLKDTQISATYIKKSKNDYIVELKVLESNITLIDLKLDVVSNKQAKEICDKWKNKAPYIYGEIIKLLIE